MKILPKKLEMSHLLFFVIGFLVCMLVNSNKVIEGLICATDTAGNFPLISYEPVSGKNYDNKTGELITESTGKPIITKTEPLSQELLSDVKDCAKCKSGVCYGEYSKDFENTNH